MCPGVRQAADRHAGDGPAPVHLPTWAFRCPTRRPVRPTPLRPAAPASRRPTPRGMAASCSCSPNRLTGARRGHHPGRRRPDVSGREGRLRDTQRDGGLSARLRRGRRHVAAEFDGQLPPHSNPGAGGRVKNDLALVAFATGPYHAFGPDFGPGPPSEPTWRSPWTWASTSTVFTGAVIRPGDLKRHHARAGGRNSAPAELVQTFVVDAEVVSHLVDDGDGYLLDDLVFGPRRLRAAIPGRW